jgi:cation transport ATPase
LLRRYFFHTSRLVAELPLYVTVAAGGAPLVWSLGRRLISFEFGSDLLAGLSIIASISTSQYLVGSIIVLMLAGGGALETYASCHANSVLAALHERTPKIAHRKAGETYTDIELGDIDAGDVLAAILAYEIAPVDGTVLEGHGRVDESYLTGEPFEISKAPGSSVLSGLWVANSYNHCAVDT